MTREVKIGTAVAGSFLSLVGIVVGVKLNGDISPQNPETIAQSEQAPKAPESKNSSEQTNAPGVIFAGALQGAIPVSDQLPVGQGNGTPLGNGPQNPGTPPSIPAPPPNFGALTPPAPSSAEFNLPLPNPAEATANAGNDASQRLNEKIRSQEQQNGSGFVDKNKKEFANAGNPFAENQKKNDQFNSPPQAQGQNAIDNLPAPSDLNKLTFPSPAQTAAADHTILNSGGKKATAPSESMPPLQPNSNLSPPKLGSDAPAPPPPPPSDPQPQKDLFAPIGSNPQQPAFNPNPPLPPMPGANQQPLIPTPNTPIVATKPNDPAGLPAPTFTNPQGANNAIPAPPAVGALPTVPNPNLPSGPNSITLPTIPGPPPFTNNLPPAGPFPEPPNANFSPSVPPVSPTAPVVKIDNPQRYVCQANETYALISRNKYGTETYARALEAYNRNLPGAPANVAADPAQLQPGTVLLLPSANTLLDYGAPAVPGSNLPPIPSPTANSRPFGSDIGLNPPTPSGNAPPRPAATPDTSVKSYRVPTAGMYLSQVAQSQLGSALRWIDIYRLNPSLQPEQPLTEGIIIRVPAK